MCWLSTSEGQPKYITAIIQPLPDEDNNNGNNNNQNGERIKEITYENVDHESKSNNIINNDK